MAPTTKTSTHTSVSSPRIPAPLLMGASTSLQHSVLSKQEPVDAKWMASSCARRSPCNKVNHRYKSSSSQKTSTSDSSPSSRDSKQKTTNKTAFHTMTSSADSAKSMPTMWNSYTAFGCPTRPYVPMTSASTISYPTNTWSAATKPAHTSSVTTALPKPCVACRATSHAVLALRHEISNNGSLSTC